MSHFKQDTHIWYCVGGGAVAGAIAGAAALAGGVYLYTKLASKSKSGKKVAVVLSGCGVFDGAEITESTAVLCNVSGTGAEYDCFAPDVNQFHVVDHSKGQVLGYAPRSVLSEAARISRGAIKSLSSLDVAAYDAVIFPGGFGVAKNLSNWAQKGPECQVNEATEAVIKAFRDAGKPIGMCCIAPVLAAKTIKGCTVTVGKGSGAEWPYGGTVEQIESLGATHVECTIDDICVDEANNLVTSCAYMYDGKPHEVFRNVGLMVNAVLARVL